MPHLPHTVWALDHSHGTATAHGPVGPLSRGAGWDRFPPTRAKHTAAVQEGGEARGPLLGSGGQGGRSENEEVTGRTSP